MSTEIVYVCQNKETKEFVSHTTFHDEPDIEWALWNHCNVVKYSKPDFDCVRDNLWFVRGEDAWNDLLPKLVWYKLTIITSLELSPL